MNRTGTTPRLPTYRSAAAALEGHTGSGLKLAGWTAARTLLIAPPMIAVGVPWQRAFLGALLASGLISTLAVVRLYNAKQTSVVGDRPLMGSRRRRLR